MQITVLQENLKQAISYLQKVVPSKPQLSILSSILLKAENNHLLLYATDLYIGIKTEIIVEVEQEGIVVIDGEVFKSFISSLNVGKIQLKLEENVLHVSQGKIKSKISCQTAEEYPQFPEVNGDEFTISLNDLEKIQNLVMFCASNDQTRPVLTSILLKFSPENLEVVGTDGFRLAQLYFKDKSFSIDKSLLIPAKALAEFYRIAKQLGEKELKIVVSEELKQLLFKVANVQMYVRLIEGDYPPYEKIIPPEFRINIEFDTEDLLQELKRASIFARDASNIVRLEIDQDQLLIKSASPNYGEYNGSIQIKNSSEIGGKIAFNVHYLIDFINASKAEFLHFSMNESLKPAMFVNPQDKDYLFIAMPFRVSD